MYLNTEQLFIDDTGMFVEIEGKVQPLAALFRDARGLYVTRAQLEEGYTAYECPAGHPYSMDLSDLIPGCALAIKGMAIGEEREIWIHPTYAYGETSNIAPNLGMKAIVKLIDILSDGKDDFKFVPFELAAEINRKRN